MGDESKRENTSAQPTTFGSHKFYNLLSELAESHGQWALAFGIRDADDNGFVDDPLASARYTAPDFAVEPWVYELMRSNENMRRLQAQIASDSPHLDDLRKCFLDVATHALMALIFFEEDCEEFDEDILDIDDQDC